MKATENYSQYLERYADEMALDEYYENMLTSTGEKLNFVRLGPSQTVQYYVSPRSYKIMNDVWMDVRTRGTVAGFTTEKNIELLQRIIKWVTLPAGSNIILDSFAGSGTTGHAVLQQNWEDGGNRSFILVEMEIDICRNITFDRMKKVTLEKMGQLDGLKSGFSCYEIGAPLFDAQGFRKEISFEDVARYVFFTETSTPMPESTNGQMPFLGCANGIGVYLLYGGVLGNGENALTRAVLNCLPPHDGPKVIYGTSCRIGATTLRRESITFRQVAYDVRRV